MKEHPLQILDYQDTKVCKKCLIEKPLQRKYFWKMEKGEKGFCDTCRKCTSNERNKKRSRRLVKSLDDMYVRAKLAASMHIKAKEVPDILVDVEKLRSLIKRQILKGMKNGKR